MEILVDPGFEDFEYAGMVGNRFFLDKTEILPKLWECIGDPIAKYVCVTRPRRFGKSTAAEMVASFFGPKDSSELFDGLAISQHPQYTEFLNTHHVIYMNLIAEEYSGDISPFLTDVKAELIHKLHVRYPQVEPPASGTVSLYLGRIFDQTGHRFVFVIDEWDHILHQDKVSDADKKAYLRFFTGLLKGRAYVALAYMTGILPISMYSAGSDLNMFRDYTFINDSTFDTDFGFTEAEVDELYTRYQQRHGDSARISRDDLTHWYNGYTTETGKRLYNPKSIVEALSFNKLDNYWGNSGPFDEVFHFVRDNTDSILGDIEALLMGQTVAEVVDSHFVGKPKLLTRKDILSALVVYGLLTAEPTGSVIATGVTRQLRIPNQEIRSKFVSSIVDFQEYDDLHLIAMQSRRFVQALNAGDAQAIAETIGQVHAWRSPVKSFNNELELAHALDWVLVTASPAYRYRREVEAGHGFADCVLVPVGQVSTLPVFIIELKVGADPGVALAQIRSRGYGEQFACDPRFRGRIVGVGISYDPKDPAKTHYCEIEVLREAL